MRTEPKHNHKAESSELTFPTREDEAPFTELEKRIALELFLTNRMDRASQGQKVCRACGLANWTGNGMADERTSWARWARSAIPIVREAL